MRLFYFISSLLKKVFSIVNFRKNFNSKKISQIKFDNAKSGIKNKYIEDIDNANIDKIINFEEDQISESKMLPKKIKLKNKIKNLISFIICVVVILFIVFSPIFIFNKQNYQTDVSELLLDKSTNATILTIWHVETFEGGSASRTKFLESQAIAFNKKQKDCFIVVKILNENQLFLNLEQNKYPDMFSFGVGSGYMISSFLQELSNNKIIREDLSEYGKLNGQILAYPYMLGGYIAITREKDFDNENLQNNFVSVSSSGKSKQKLGFGLSTADFTFGLQALYLNNAFNLSKKDMFEADTSYNAYTAFLKNKFKTLVGTTRDLDRCKKRELNGTIDSCVYSYLGGFSDLVQYIGVNKNIDNKKRNLSNKFINYLLEDFSQKSIAKYGLFGVTNNKIYFTDYYSDFENKLLKNITSINVFSSLKEIESKKQKALSKLLN